MAAKNLLVATEELLESMLNGCSTLHITDTTKNLFGFWVEAGIPARSLKRPIEFLSKMNRLNQMGYNAKDDTALFAIQQQKTTLEKEYEMQTHEAIMELVLILKAFVAN